MGLQGASWYMKIIREIFAFVDKLVYGLIKWILFGIFDLSRLTTNSEVFSGIYSRIYIILGIFMAFKLAFSFFQYIIDPDSMTGKGEKTISKLFMRVFIMLAALIFLPAILFGNSEREGFLPRAQRAFLPTLPKFLFGVNDIGGLATDGDNFSASIEQSADEIATITLSGFFAPSKELDEVCGQGTYENTPPIKTLDDFSNNITLTCDKTGTGFVGLFATQYYKYSYMMFVSTVVGVLIAALLLGITLDIAKRIFKLMILEVIAPIPIMSLIDPKGSKDGAFSKWVHSLITTFLDIFLKLGLVYIIIILIHMIVNSGDSGGMFTNFPSGEGTEFRQVYLTILLILGLIFFAKEAPKFIKESMGIKDSGGGLFDDVKSIGKAAGLVGGAAVGTVGAIGGNLSAAATAIKEGHGLSGAMSALNSPGAALAGAIRGAKSGMSGANKGNPLKGWAQAANTQIGINANKRANAAAGSTALGRTGARLSNFFTGQTAADRDETHISAYKDAVDSAKNFKNVLADSAGKSKYGLTVNGHSNVTAREFKGLLAAANSGDASAISDLKTKYGFSSLAAANSGAAEFEKAYQKAYYDAIKDGTIDANKDGDAAAVLSANDVADANIKGLHLTDMSGVAINEVNASNSGAVIGAATTAGNKIKSGKKYVSNKRNAAAVKKGGK